LTYHATLTVGSEKQSYTLYYVVRLGGLTSALVNTTLGRWQLVIW